MKTHWLQSPNKNYLGRWDLPEGNDVILTIKSVGWEEVINHTVFVKGPDGKSRPEVKNLRVIRFVEEMPWVKPFICNETNAKMIYECTKTPYMEDCIGMKIKLGVSNVKVQGQQTQAIRVRKATQEDLQPQKINREQVQEIKSMLKDNESINEDKICKAYKIKDISLIPAKDYDAVVERIIFLSSKGAKNETL